MLWAVYIPGVEVEEEHSLRRGSLAGVTVVGVGEPLEELLVVFHDLRASPELDASTIRVVHEEDERLRVLLQVAHRDVLPIAAEVGERERALVEHLEEALGTTPVLHVGLAIGAGSAEIEGVPLGDEPLEIGRDLRLPTAAFFHAGVAGSGTEPFLHRLHAGREGNVAYR